MTTYYVISLLIIIYVIVSLVFGYKAFKSLKYHSKLNVPNTNNSLNFNAQDFKITQKFKTLDFINKFENFNNCDNCPLVSKNKCNNYCSYNLNKIQEIKLKIQGEI